MALLPVLAAAVAEVDPRIAFRALPVEEWVNRSLARERLLALLSGFFGGLALLLALVGLYGLMAYNVARRRNEIGIRLALGAARGRVVGMIVGEVGRLVAAGLVLGLAAALAGGQLVRTFLYGLTPADPGTLAAATGLVLLVSLVAGGVPAWRASRMDPAEALREE
ncbi:MAG: FtsX-like permease family protein [Gemmatimonadetes bacterium]|nr:FtsX-like permease family protein [Gemmatimonadota bacterium]